MRMPCVQERVNNISSHNKEKVQKDYRKRICTVQTGEAKGEVETDGSFACLTKTRFTTK